MSIVKIANDSLEKEQNKAKIENEIMSKGLIPIYKDNKIYIYKLSPKETFKDIKDYLKENMVNTYNKVMLTSNDFKYQLNHGFYKDMISYKISTKKEVFDYFKINDSKSKNDIINKIANEIGIYEARINNKTIRVFIPKNEIYNSDIENDVLNIFMSDYLNYLSTCSMTHLEFLKNSKRIDTPLKKDLDFIKKTLDNINERYITIKFKSPSKLYETVDLIAYDYVNPYLIVSSIHEFIYGKELPLTDGIHIMDKVESMSFNEKEQNLSHEEKISIIKNIIDSFNIDMIFEYDAKKLSSKLIESILGIESKKEIINLGKYNFNLLNSKEVLNIYNEINEGNTKTLKYKKR